MEPSQQLVGPAQESVANGMFAGSLVDTQVVRLASQWAPQCSHLKVYWHHTLPALSVIQAVDSEAHGGYALHIGQIIHSETGDMFLAIVDLAWDPSTVKIPQGPSRLGTGATEPIALGKALKNAKALLVTGRGVGADQDVEDHDQVPMPGGKPVPEAHDGWGQVMIQFILIVGHGVNLWRRARHQGSHVVHPATLIYQLMQLLKTLNTYRFSQHAVIVGAGMKVAQPARHLVSHAISHWGAELMAMDLPVVRPL